MLYINLSDDSYSIAKIKIRCTCKNHASYCEVLLRKQTLTFILDSQNLI